MTVHSRFLTSLIAAAFLASGSGCIFTTTPSGTPGDITFTWTFGGHQCFEVPDVAQIAVQIPGQTLQNNGVYGCLNSNTAGIKLLNFRAGTYTYTISGQNSAGTVIYQATGTVVVNGNVAVPVDLQPTTSATGSAYVTWTLPAGTPVTCQYLAAVDIALDNGAPQSFNCAAGATSPGVLLQGLSVGRHNIDISARDSNGLFYYRTLNTFDVFAGGAGAQQFSLAWIVGSAPVKWSFSNGVTQLTCAQAGVTGDVGITLRDANGDTTFTSPCVNGGVQGYQIPYVYYGTYQIFLAATGTGGVIYRSSTTVPPNITVVAGDFPNIDNPNPTTAILMTP
jgi:hypothetical protein